MTLNSYSNFQKQEKSRGDHNTWYQIVLQGRCNQNSLILAQERTHRLMEQNREPRNKPKSLLLINTWQTGQKHRMELKIASSINAAGRSGQLHVQINKTRPPTFTIHQHKLKVDKRLKYKLWYHISPRGEYRQENVRYSTQQYFHW